MRGSWPESVSEYKDACLSTFIKGELFQAGQNHFFNQIHMVCLAQNGSFGGTHNGTRLFHLELGLPIG